MRIYAVFVTALLCFDSYYTFAARSRSKNCRNGRCKYKLNNNRIRFLRDLSKHFYPGTNLVDITLKSLHNRKDGEFGTFDKENSLGYDIPKIECQRVDNIERLPCPTPDVWHRFHCIDYYMLCDRKVQCPNGEDEDPTMCLFHSANELHLKEMMNAMTKLYLDAKASTEATRSLYKDFTLDNIYDAPDHQQDDTANLENYLYDVDHGMNYPT